MRLPRHPAPWFALFVTWFGVLWWLSSGVPEVPQALDFKLSDKLLHFGYFFGGAGLLSAALFRWKPDLHASTRILVVVIVVTLTGALDEYHQTFSPGRSGNDAADLTADFFGTIVGAFFFQRVRQVVS
jgi:VanZ family protein